ncbi:hypothetical protein BX616_003142 [Lobosporangium transversale]|uniref:ABC transporter domain-containing protein n=1 Tax=Lobosporangium transversale TaxID=64571 RepID=A0A1Y2GC49_9FUNG|nr:hypothetical protein BCR41DRAFT_425014 [Lobosporangium transversale]KAF9899253.1 hypothetical protein BX616_003142 [Lobosporangium transversale]ORZ06776.1 hypothetical protein BCR41DRAFT_425014 [Lobosporangium transversale]|eukprot:XP_021877697.1 hypothetical protein BCR41DRAFT_425014 [Lobosporangium transversale]
MDPLDYYALLNLVDAPGVVPGRDPKCQYVQTPLKSSANASTPTWGCPAGHFCVSPKHSAPCTPGFYCPPNTAQPMYCCPGYYCSNDTTTLTICPQNQYCPAGSVGGGVSCLWLASCPAGSSSASKFGLVLFVIIFIIGIYIVFWIHKRFERVRTQHLEKRLRWIHNHNANHDNLLIEDEQDDDDDDGCNDEKSSGSGTHDDNGNSNSRHRIRDQVIDIDGNKSTPHRSDSDRTAVGETSPSSKPVDDVPQRPKLRRKVTKVTHSFDIEFERLSLTLSNGTTILQNVSGQLKAGRSCAIMGPSGSGKTTLISILTSKMPKNEGRVLINGQEEDLSHYRKLIGYVPQDDIMMRELTVHDILLHSAYMRLPAKLTKSQMTEKVLEIVDFLGLNSVMDSVVGDAEKRGISGGQRKRVNIGMELVTDPSILFLDEPTSGLDSSTSGDVCKLLRAIARKKGLTVAAVIHSPSPVAFDQFDDLLLLGHGGRVVFHGPRTEAPAYFSAIGFPLPKDSSPSDFYMDVISNNVKSKISKNFKPFYLHRYWESYCKRAQTFYAAGNNGVEYRHPSPYTSNPSLLHLNSRASGCHSLDQSAMSVQHQHRPELSAMPNMSGASSPALSPSSVHSPGAVGPSSLHPSSASRVGDEKRHSQHKSVTRVRDLALEHEPKSGSSTPRASMALSEFHSMYDSPPLPEKLTWVETTKGALRIFLIDSRMWWHGVFAETKETVLGLFLKRRDPIRNTASPFKMFWLCLSRARLQIYRSRRQFLYDQLLHLGCGMFISIAASKFDYLGRQHDMVCAMTPFQLKPSCFSPTDHLAEVGVFIALGVCFAGISVGSVTFGNEKLVYWREKSSGLLTLPYYLAKVIADIPRIVLAGIMFSISLIIFFNERSNYFYLLFIIIMLYAIAFAMGYLLSALIPAQRVALVGTGFTLAWAIVFSGDAPDLADVMSDSASGGYRATSWIWTISAPRYAIEAIYLREVQARPWVEIQNAPLAHTYKLDQFWWCFRAMACILLGWHVLAFISFKLKDRSKQR